MLIAIVAISYILAINVFGFRIVKIQRADRLKNGDPIPTPAKPKELAGKAETDSKTATDENKTDKNTNQLGITKTVAKNSETDHTKKSKVTAKSQKYNANQPHNGDKMEKDDILKEEKLNLKRYERIPDLKILMVAIFGGALGEFISFLIYKYRTTNTLLMVALPVLISVWVYLFYVLIGGFFIV